jgi:hypothetical protein
MIIDRDVKNRILAQIAMSRKDHETDLRDYFAGQALAGILACVDAPNSKVEIVKHVYQLADAMMEARKR